VGVSGSVDVGNYVVLGGQVGIAGHIKIGDGVQAAGKSAIAASIPPGKKVGGLPAVDFNLAKRNAMISQDLYGMAKRLRALERAFKRLRGESEDPGRDDASS
jgi:UDP-3-O-[3-hydroxymyristoyl] glucosamine N-acyltransferase